jgi:hypothetical protein
VCPQSQFGVLKNVARKQLELATCGLRQIIVKFWKFFLTPMNGISGHLYVSQSVCEMVTFFQEQTINMNTYLDVLQMYAVPQIVHLQPYILQQDGAPPHWGLQVRACLDRTFPGRWIGRDGPMPWPPHSPDVTMDFFLWSYFKSNVFRTPVNGLHDLKARIRNAI